MQSFANRGMKLEQIINNTILDLRTNDIALIYKRPVEIIAVKTNKGKITNGYFKTFSTCDYYGLYKGYYFEFEAKETKLEKFSFSNIKNHQWKQLNDVKNHNGISFIIVSFTSVQEYYILPFLKIKSWLENQPVKQIPLNYFKQYGIYFNIDKNEDKIINLLDAFNQLISYI